MAQHNFETKLKEALFKKCSQCAKYLIPKELYYKTIDDLKPWLKFPLPSHVTSTASWKSIRYFNVVMWRSLSRRESHQKSSSLLCHHRRHLHYQQNSYCNWPRWSWQIAETSWAKVSQHCNRCRWTLRVLVHCMSREKETSKEYRCCCQAYSFQQIQLLWSSWSSGHVVIPTRQFM